MNLISIGIDLVEVPRIQALLDKTGDLFKERVFTREEISYCDSCAVPAIHYAARFAAKEAVGKALGTGLAEGVTWRDIEVRRNSSGLPSIVLHEGALRKAAELGIREMRVSLSHTAQMAAANVAGVG